MKRFNLLAAALISLTTCFAHAVEPEAGKTANILKVFVFGDIEQVQ
jgi:hypothetical protein